MFDNNYSQAYRACESGLITNARCMKRIRIGPLLARTLSTIIILIGLGWAPAPAVAQLPFLTDDTDTTSKRKFHLDLSNEFDWLQRDALPGKRQNTTVLTLNYGLTDRIELGANVPYIKLYNDRASRLGDPSGIGDMQFGLKARLLEERENSRMPAIAVVFYLDTPTGSTRRQLGSGLTDYWLYAALQKSLTKRTKGRLNGGVVFTGNRSIRNGAVQNLRGEIFTASGSLVRDFTSRLKLGGELFGAATNNFNSGQRQIVGQIGGGYMLTERFELTFGLLSGRLAASPRLGVNLGFAYDFK